MPLQAQLQLPGRATLFLLCNTICPSFHLPCFGIFQHATCFYSPLPLHLTTLRSSLVSPLSPFASMLRRHSRSLALFSFLSLSIISSLSRVKHGERVEERAREEEREKREARAFLVYPCISVETRVPLVHVSGREARAAHSCKPNCHLHKFD